ncbi:LOW QUALITY PROTEIN: protein nullo [Drosophila ficusphila]|uniref:LOW QUALITY PROTEIN: protein nullo n=1 Tax=Drosophila ficusphila TaxID=30025 RepID=UPI001C8AEBE6|nr:LOW QUALITY PROTEIN: protein nullo [Drosophila ficusphila]
MGSSQSTEKVKSSEDSTSPASPGLFCASLPGFVAKMQRILLRKLNISARKQKRLSKRSRQILRPMPRCSSFGSCGTLLTPPTKKCSMATLADRRYAQWKCSFEHLAQRQERLHDISEAIAGQTTPRGFPSHTDARRCLLPQEEESQLPESPLYDMVRGQNVRRRLSLRSHALVRRPSARQKAAQAKVDAQLKRDLCDLEEYYGGFHFAQRSERLVKV